MNGPISANATPAIEPRKPARRRRVRPSRKKPAPVPARALGQGLTSEAGRRAAAILEVLAGERTPREVAQSLGVSLPYFYLLERKALQGLIQACELLPKGPPGPSSEEKLAQLEKSLARSERECQRMAALVRVTQQAVGLPASQAGDTAGRRGVASGSAKGDKQLPTPGKTRRRRRPVVRALRAAKVVRQNSSGPKSASGLEPSSTAKEGQEIKDGKECRIQDITEVGHGG